MRFVGLSLAKAGFAGKRKRRRFPGWVANRSARVSETKTLPRALPFRVGAPGTPTFEGLDGNATLA